MYKNAAVAAAACAVQVVPYSYPNEELMRKGVKIISYVLLSAETVMISFSTLVHSNKKIMP